MHPCLSCGACCAHYRVSLHWSETETFGTPLALTETFGPHTLVMRGTWQPQPHCAALQGEVGREAHCSIYAQRPSPCRDLHAMRPRAPGLWHGAADARRLAQVGAALQRIALQEIADQWHQGFVLVFQHVVAGIIVGMHFRLR